MNLGNGQLVHAGGIFDELGGSRVHSGVIRAFRVGRVVAIGGLPAEASLLGSGVQCRLPSRPFETCNKLFIHLYVLFVSPTNRHLQNNHTTSHTK